MLLLQQRRVFDDAQNLPKECNGFLIQLLGIPNVCGDNSIERQLSSTICGRIWSSSELLAVGIRFSSNLASNGIFGFDDMRIDVVDVECLAGGGGRHGSGSIMGDYLEMYIRWLSKSD